MKGYYFITDSRLSRAGIFRDAAAAVKAGVEVVQYRNKCSATKILYQEALRIRSICSKTLFLINDRVDIALAVGADGVHLGQDDMPYAAARLLLGKKRIIGMTVHSVAQAVRAQALGADYLGVSCIFPTRTKPDAGLPQGVALLRRIRAHTRIPLVAIGGITLASAPLVISAGADALCAISAVVTRPKVSVAIGQFQDLFKS